MNKIFVGALLLSLTGTHVLAADKPIRPPRPSIQAARSIDQLRGWITVHCGSGCTILCRGAERCSSAGGGDAGGATIVVWSGPGGPGIGIGPECSGLWNSFTCGDYFPYPVPVGPIPLPGPPAPGPTPTPTPTPPHIPTVDITLPAGPPPPTIYKVAGKTAADLRKVLGSTLKDPDGAYVYAIASLQGDIKIVDEQLPDNSYKATVVKSSITYKKEMPSWSGYSSASACMKKSWDDMYTALDSHENAHFLYFQKFDQYFKEELQALLPSYPTKDDLRFAIFHARDRAIARIKAETIAFDLSTDHGFKTGVVLKDCP